MNKSDGALEAAVSIGYKINSCMPLEPVFDGDFSDLMRFNNMDYTVGFDLSTSIEHQIFNTLLGRAYMRLPIVPGRWKTSCIHLWKCAMARMTF